MRVSIIIPAFNEERLLGANLKCIREAAAAVFSARGWSFEVIVCDNNSSDATAQIAREGGAAVVFEPHNQISRARNTGARAARGEWLLFIDADSAPTKELFADTAEAMASGRCIAGGATVRLSTDHRIALAATGFWNLLSRSLRYVAGSYIFCESRVFFEIGGFDETLYASEEISLSKHLKRLARRRGRKIVILNAHPLLTSGRKVGLYTIREHLAVLGRALFTGKRSLRSREHCALWYDGRR